MVSKSGTETGISCKPFREHTQRFMFAARAGTTIETLRLSMAAALPLETRPSSRRIAGRLLPKDTSIAGPVEYEMPPLETMIKELTSGTEAARQTALAWLVDLIDGLPTAELLSVCAELRESGTCAMLVKLLAVPALHEDALLVLSNIAADAVDVHAKQTRELLKREDVMNSIFPYLWTESYESVLYALAALVHFVDDVSQIQGLLIASARLRLQQIVEEGDDMLATFATSCIKRMPEATAMEKEAVRAAEEQRAAMEAALPDTESEGEKARALIQSLEKIKAMEAAAEIAAKAAALERTTRTHAERSRDRVAKAGAERASKAIEESLKRRVETDNRSNGAHRGHQSSHSRAGLFAPPARRQSDEAAPRTAAEVWIRPLNAFERSARILDPQGNFKPNILRPSALTPLGVRVRQPPTALPPDEPLLPLGLAGLDRQGLKVDHNGRIVPPAGLRSPRPRRAALLSRRRLASLGSKIDQLRFPDLTRAHTHTSLLTFAQGTAEVKRRGDPNLTVSASMPTLPSLRSLQHAPDTEAHESVPEQRRQSPQPMRSEQEAKREALAEARRKAAAQAEARQAAKEAEEMKAACRVLVAKKDGDDDSDGEVEVF